jgi:hypothetical protein
MAAGGRTTITTATARLEANALIGRDLERAGYRVLAASTSTETEALFAREAGGIDLLVTDVALPDGSGPALFKRLFEKRPPAPSAVHVRVRGRNASTGPLLNPMADSCRSHFWPMDSSARFARHLIDDGSIHLGTHQS